MPQKKAQVWVYFREGAECLFLLLKTNAERGGFWQPVTGSIEPGESVESGAIREFREETGLEPLGKALAVSEPFEFNGRFGAAVEYPFLIEVSPESRQKVKLDSREHQDVQWCGAESAFELLKYESNAQVLRAILRVLTHNKEK